jgi:hypothetical protein
VATKDGFAVVAMEATDEGVTVAGLAGGPEETGGPAQDAPKPEE